MAPGIKVACMSSKILGKTSLWNKHPPLPYAFCFLFYLYGMWQQKISGGPLKILMDCGIVPQQDREILCMCPTHWKLMTINNWGNLVLFPFAGHLPADTRLKQSTGAIEWLVVCLALSLYMGKDIQWERKRSRGERHRRWSNGCQRASPWTTKRNLTAPWRLEEKNVHEEIYFVLNAAWKRRQAGN